MFTNQVALFCVVALAFGLQLIQALELVEMNDTNKNAMRLHLSKALAAVQDAYSNEYKFNSLEELRQFLNGCAHVKSIMSESDDSAFDGLAGQIKKIIAAPEVAIPCSVEEVPEQFNQLDHLSEGYNYLSFKVLEELNELREESESDEALHSVMNHLIQSEGEELAKALLASATDSVETLFGEPDDESRGLFDFYAGTRLKKLCAISLVEPVCRLVRRSPVTVQVIAADFDDFTEMLKGNDQNRMERYASASGVTIDQVRQDCRRMLSGRLRVFKPFELMERYQSAGFLTHEQIEARMDEDSDLSSYRSLYNLCRAFQE
jgi:hypothetical protein